MLDWAEASILVTGGTGSFGRKFATKLLEKYKPARLVIFSRDELKQSEMRDAGYSDPSLRFFIGDVRDIDRLKRAMQGIDIVVHAAALKQVPACEYNPIEAVQTNVTGAKNVIEAALDNGVRRVMAISTDKAVNPVNLYGATKLVAEKLFVQANAYRGDGPTRFSCARYGNVVGSRGSVVPLFLKQSKEGELTITDDRMTRFWLTLDRGVDFVISCIEQMHGGEVFVPKLPSMSVRDIAEAIAPGIRTRVIGIRPGEKLHEVLINEDEARQAVESEEMFVIQPAHPWWDYESWSHASPLAEGFRYASDSNDRWLTAEELKSLLETQATT